MITTRTARDFWVAKRPLGKWGWFYFYNPVNNKFANKFVKGIDCAISDNRWVFKYQELAMLAIFGEGFKKIPEAKRLKDINSAVSKVYDFIEKNDELVATSLISADKFMFAFHVFVDEYDKFKPDFISREKLAGLFVLLEIDCIIRDCDYMNVTETICSVHRLENVFKIMCPEQDVERMKFVKYGKRKGEMKRQSVISDYNTMGEEFWEKEKKYDDKIRLLERRYKIGTTTAKKYYSMLKKLV